jgi:phosphoglycolate phosphatase-like HAD superfamily hydrolase
MAPRLTMSRLYAEAKGLDPKALVRRHMQYLETYQYWIRERLELLGHGAEDAEAELLGLRPEEVAEAVDAVLEAFRSKPEDAAALPPLLTLPEKLAVLEAAAAQLVDALRRRGGVLRSWLYVLHSATHRGPYVEAAEELGLLRWVIALEAAALDVGTKNELDALLAAYARRVPGLDQHIVYSAFRYMASDVEGITMAVPDLPPERITEMLEF